MDRETIGADGGLAHDWPIFGDDEAAVLQQVVDSGTWGHAGRHGYVGEFELKFERAFADFQTARHGLCVTNGTVALQLALEALEIGCGDEVIVPGLTWQATAGAVLDVNAEPILVDVEPDTYCIDPAAVEEAVTSRTRAVIAVHLYNCLADLDRLARIADKHGIHLIEDCAHSHGSAWRGQGVGSIGAIGCFSFQSSKSLTAGEGGFCTTNSDSLKDRIETLRSCGRRPADSDEGWRPVQSGNYRLSEWEAAVLWIQFQRFPQQLALREENAQRLDEAIAAIPGVSPMRCPAQVTRRGLYAYVFRYDATAFSGMPVSSFRSSLEARLGIPVDSTYEPLNNSALYQPQTKPRHRLSAEYWAHIDASRFELPVAERAYREEAVVIPHEVLLHDWNRLRQLPAAIVQIQADSGRPTPEPVTVVSVQ